MKQIIIKNEFITLVCINYGAIVQKLIVKDKNGIDTNVVIGFKEPEDYLNNPYYLGACIGRCAGRINDEGLKLEEGHFPLYTKDGVHLHGGKEPFSHKYWNVEEVNEDPQNPFVKFSYISKHLEEGYPGNLKIFVTYTLERNKLVINYEAETDQFTVVNLTNHSYFNLEGKGNILTHELQLTSEAFLELNEKQLPTGRFKNVLETGYDFLQPKKINHHGNFKGIDDYFILKNEGPVATLYAESSGIEMNVNTNQPIVVIYTPPQLPSGNYSNESVEAYSSICFENQKYPYTPEQTHFPSSVLKKDEKYFNQSIFEFNIRR